MKAIILAAGMGRRLGHELPKCLTRIAGETTILDMQLAHLRHFVDEIRLVVGYRCEDVKDRYRDCTFTLNKDYAATNTAVSLSLGLKDIDPAESVLWLNGDVVCSREVLARVCSAERSVMAGKRGHVAEEEVKYVTDEEGRILAVSKQLAYAKGEAVGVNLVRHADRQSLQEGLGRCGPMDYFERGIELAIAMGLRIFEVDVSDQPCIEVDFPEDLRTARAMAPHVILPTT